MKTCGYCGRENEDSAIVCRECGLSEFPETAEEKARAAQSLVEPEPEPEPLAPDVTADSEAAICPFCLFPNLPEREWCKQCGTPFNTSVMGPFEAALAEGFVYRGIVRGRPKPIVLITMWVLCLPLVIVGACMILAGFLLGVLPIILFGLVYIAIPGSILFQVTRNFTTIPKPKLDE